MKKGKYISNKNIILTLIYIIYIDDVWGKNKDIVVDESDWLKLPKIKELEEIRIDNHEVSLDKVQKCNVSKKVAENIDC